MNSATNLIILIFLGLIICTTSFSQKTTNIDIKLITVQEIIDYAFEHNQVVMMNEAHFGLKRNIRTRLIGQIALIKAHAKGVRHIAMEALDLNTDFVNEANKTRKIPQVDINSFGYLGQPEMRNLMQAALDLGWTLISYEANRNERPEFNNSMDRSNWREKEQAKNLAEIVKNLGKNAKLLVWCGNSHNSKEYGTTPAGTLYPMGYQFWQLTDIEPFEIDQIVTIGSNPNDQGDSNKRFEKWSRFEPELRGNYLGTLGFIIHDKKSAKIISIYNKVE